MITCMLSRKVQWHCDNAWLLVPAFNRSLNARAPILIHFCIFLVETVELNIGRASCHPLSYVQPIRIDEICTHGVSTSPNRFHFIFTFLPDGSSSQSNRSIQLEINIPNLESNIHRLVIVPFLIYIEFASAPNFCHMCLVSAKCRRKMRSRFGAAETFNDNTNLLG